MYGNRKPPSHPFGGGPRYPSARADPTSTRTAVAPIIPNPIRRLCIAASKSRLHLKGVRRLAREVYLPFYEPAVFVLAVIVQAEVMACISVRFSFDAFLTPVTTDLDHPRLLSMEMPVFISFGALDAAACG